MAIKETFLRPRRKILLAKLETTYGVDAGPTGAADAILTQNLVIKPVMEFQERKTDRRSFGKDLSQNVSKFVTFEFDVDMQSSGAVGTAPGWGKLLKACGYSQTIGPSLSGTVGAAAASGALTITLGAGASAVDGFYKGSRITLRTPAPGPLGARIETYKITAYTGATKQATIQSVKVAGPGLISAITTDTTYQIAEHYATATGGSANTIQLAAAADGASVVDDFYNGQVVKITSGTGAGQTRLIGAYNGTTRTATVTEYWDLAPDATSVYSITGLGSAYQPNSATWDALTLYGHMDGQLRAATGARGTVSVKMNAGQHPMFHFVFTGLWADPITATDPTPVTTAFKLPLVVNDANTPTFTLADKDQRVYEYDWDTANDVKYRDLVNARSVSIIDRGVTGNITLEAPPLSEKNWWLDSVQEKVRPLNIVHGVDAGYIVELFAPRVQWFDPTDGDKDGVLTTQLKCSYLPLLGDDEILIIAR